VWAVVDWLQYSKVHSLSLSDIVSCYIHITICPSLAIETTNSTAVFLYSIGSMQLEGGKQKAVLFLMTKLQSLAKEIRFFVIYKLL
jgi:hypothetical protein